MTQLIYDEQGLQRLAAAIVVRAHKDSRGRFDGIPDEEQGQRIRYEAAEWMRSTGRDWVDVLLPQVRQKTKMTRGG